MPDCRDVGGRRRALQGPMIIVLRACGSKDLTWLGWSLPSSWPSWCSRDAETRRLVRTLEVWREMPRISWKEGHSRGPAMRGWLQGRSQMGWNLP